MVLFLVSKESYTEDNCIQLFATLLKCTVQLRLCRIFLKGRDMNQNMLKDSPAKALIVFSLPILFGNFLQQFYSIVDSIIVGNFVSANALGSIGNTMPIVFMVTCVSFGLANGASILIGQTVGANRQERIPTLSVTSLVYAMIIAVVLTIIFIPNADNLVTLINTPLILQADSTRYLSIYFLGLVFIFGFNMISAVFRSLGDSKTPLLFLGVASILNILLDLIFVLVFQMGVQGVAIATVIAQSIAFTLQLILLRKRLKEYKQSESKLIDMKAIKQLSRLALPTTSQEILISVGLILTQVLTNRFGAEVVSAYTATSKISEFAMLPMINLGIGMTVFTAQNVGANQIERVRKAYHSMLKITLSFALIMAMLVILFPYALMTLFLGNNITPAIYVAGESYLIVSAITFFFMAILFSAESLLKGAGDVHMFLFIAVTGSIIKIVASVILIPYLGYQGIWIGIAVGWLVEAILTLLRYKSSQWKTKKIKDI